MSGYTCLSRSGGCTNAQAVGVEARWVVPCSDQELAHAPQEVYAGEWLARG